MVTRPFMNGAQLSQVFYEEAVKPMMAEYFPGLAYSAALLGEGSDVLGFDTPQSMDHAWGPRLQIFLSEGDFTAHRDRLDELLRQKLPREIQGYPTNFDLHEDGTSFMAPAESGPVAHRVDIHTLRHFFKSTLNFDLDTELRAQDWLTFPEQLLRSISSGRVYHDGLGRLEVIRAKLRYYPRDVWLYLLASQWRRIDQEEPFMGRCGQVGDDLGSRLVAGRLVRDMMRLCFLMERRYAPYIKWFGTAFKQLDCAPDLIPTFIDVMDASTWQERESALVRAYEYIAKKHNDLGITEPMPAKVSSFHNRPFLVIHAERYSDAIRGVITSAEVLALPENLGSIDQFVDSTDVLSYPCRLSALKAMYQ